MLGEPPPMPKLRAPYPFFGGKSRAAHLIWQALGDVKNYVEPFAGSLATLLLRPHAPHIETVNDLDCYIANFWRALQADPESVIRWCDAPVNEADLTARHRWLVSREEFREAMMADPHYYDAKIAGWWVWGLSAWVGSGWCDGKARWQLPHRGSPQGAIRICSQRPSLSSSGTGIHGHTRTTDELRALSARLRRVRVACGDWRRVLTNSVLNVSGAGWTRGILLDPPYADTAKRDANLYAQDSLSVAHDVAAWAIEHGDKPLNRIVLCGYEGEHDMPDSWRVVEWKASGGYGSQASGQARANSRRERLWLSPACLPVVGERPVREAVAS